MISPPDPSTIETGIRDYLAASAGYLALSLPGAMPEDADAPVPDPGPPPILLGLDKTQVDPQQITILCTVPEMEAEGVGWYNAAVHLWVITPYTVEGNTLAHHQAAMAALGAAFPMRPTPGSAELAAWTALHTSLGETLDAVNDYQPAGWYPSQGAYSIEGGKWEQRLTVSLGLAHSDLLD